MYAYDDIDQQLVDERVAQFRDQTRRFLAGELSEDDFRPLRLQNGLYIERHAPMLRVAIPYGLLASRQLRALATIARKWDRGYGHCSTRQNRAYPVVTDRDFLSHSDVEFVPQASIWLQISPPKELYDPLSARKCLCVNFVCDNRISTQQTTGVRT